MSNKKMDDSWKLLGKNSIKDGPSDGEYAFSLGKSEKLFTIAQMGEWLEAESFSKYPAIYYRMTINQGLYDNFRSCIKELRSDEWGESYISKAQEFIKLWERVFLDEKHPEFWSYLLALHQEFYPPEVDELARVYQLAIPIYERSFHLAGLTFYAAVKSGIYDGEMLKEIFLVSLFLDAGLAHPSFHYNLYSALELDRCGKQSGTSFLKKCGHSSEDIKFYQNHSHVSYTICREKLKNFVSNDRLIELIKIHHEGGPHAFPRKLTTFECDDIELIIILINQALPYVAIHEIKINDVIDELNRLKKTLQSHHLRGAG